MECSSFTKGNEEAELKAECGAHCETSRSAKRPTSSLQIAAMADPPSPKPITAQQKAVDTRKRKQAEAKAAAASSKVHAGAGVTLPEQSIDHEQKQKLSAAK